MAITHSDRRSFVEGVTKLSLWYLYSRRPAPEGCYTLLTGQTPIFRLTAYWDGHSAPPVGSADGSPPEWSAIVSDIADLHRSYRPGTDTLTFEEAGLLLLWPHLAPRIERDVRAWPWIPSCLGAEIPETGVFGFFLYEFDTADPDLVILHMGNAFAPESPFADPPARARELLSLLDDAASRNPTASRLASTTWLNGFVPFQQFFPPEWVNSAVASAPSYTYDWWGQFVDRRGAFHRANGGSFRQTGRFPYPSVTCAADIASVRKHLTSRFGLT
jgi:hypothetical protein